VFWRNPCEDADVFDAAWKVDIGDFIEFAAGHEIFAFGRDASFFCNVEGGFWMVAGYHDDANALILAPGDTVRNFFADIVTHGDKTGADPATIVFEGYFAWTFSEGDDAQSLFCEIGPGCFNFCVGFDFADGEDAFGGAGHDGILASIFMREGGGATLVGIGKWFFF